MARPEELGKQNRKKKAYVGEGEGGDNERGADWAQSRLSFPDSWRGRMISPTACLGTVVLLGGEGGGEEKVWVERQRDAAFFCNSSYK